MKKLILGVAVGIMATTLFNTQKSDFCDRACNEYCVGSVRVERGTIAEENTILTEDGELWDLEIVNLDVGTPVYVHFADCHTEEIEDDYIVGIWVDSEEN